MEECGALNDFAVSSNFACILLKFGIKMNFAV